MMRRSRFTLADQKQVILGAGHPVQAEARVGDVGLQVKGGGLGCPLLLVGEPDRLAVNVSAMRMFIGSLSAYRQASPGIMRNMKRSNKGTVNAVSPWLGLHTIPLLINWLRVGASDCTERPRACDISPER